MNFPPPLILFIIVMCFIHPLIAVVIAGCWLAVNVALIIYHAIAELMKEILK